MIPGLILGLLAVVLGRCLVAPSVPEPCRWCGRDVSRCDGYCPESGREVRR